MTTSRDDGPGLSRRALLGGLGAGAGLLLTGGLGGLPGRPPGGRFAGLDWDACLARLDASLSPAQRAFTVHPWDHPSRQITNTVTIFRGPHIGTLFDAEQVALIHRLYATLVSDQGRDWLRNTVTLEGRLEGCVLAIFSDAAPGALARERGRSQVMITGAHLMLRGGGEARSGYAFGGPIAYGQQLGNGEFRVRGNAFAVHGDAANRVYAALDEDARAAARVPRAPHELMVQPQGPEGRFEGLALRRAGAAARERAAELLETVLASYPETARRDALDALEENGGLDALHLSVYEETGFYADGRRWTELDGRERAERERPYWQVWRLEGPGAVIHFKGHPHVHAYVDIVRDPRRQNVGEVLTRAAAPLGAPGVRRLLEDALRQETGEALAFHPEAVPARVCAGDVTTGLAHALDPFQETIVVARMRGAAMADPLRRGLEAQGVRVDPERNYRIATLAYPAGRAELFGEPERVEPWPRPLREALVAYLRDRDLGGFRG